MRRTRASKQRDYFGVGFGAGFDWHASKNVAVFGAVQAMAMPDRSRTAARRAACVSRFESKGGERRAVRP